jgi:hypothetical protein
MIYLTIIVLDYIFYLAIIEAMDEREKTKKILNYDSKGKPTNFWSGVTSEFTKAPPRSVWVVAGIFALAIILIFVGFLLRLCGLWTDFIATILDLMVFFLIICASGIMTIIVSKLILKRLWID